MARTTTRGTWHERIDHRASLGRGEHHATPLALKRGWSRQSTWNCCQLERTKRPELETRVAALEAMAGLGTGLVCCGFLVVGFGCGFLVVGLVVGFGCGFLVGGFWL
jgi:hypothetical protein